LLQLQTQASLHSPANSSRKSSAASASSMPPPGQSPSPKPSVDIVRCCRCQRSLTVDLSSGSLKGVVPFGVNSYYCTRCARLVGYAT
jgi:hypothetical protein